eukprot:jgi/Bigna1/127839/aug1.5_g2547
MQSHSSPQRRTIATQRQQQSSQQQQQQQQVGGAVPTAAVMAQDTPVIPPIKFLKRSSAVAWCPSSKPQHTGLMASGTTSSTIDASWSAQYSLEIFSSSFGEQSKEMRRIGAVEVAQSFCSVAWGEIGMAEGKHPAGIIAGGFSDGSIGIHDPIAIASGDGKNSRLGECRGHQGGVTCLEFHPTKKNLLASASQDGDVFIWDLANMSRPGLSKPHKASKAHAMGVTAVAWNRAPNVPFILASSSEQGITNIWDLRNKRAIVNMKSPGQYRLATTGLAWHPFDSTQIAVGYKGPVVEIWDLRKRGFPIIKISNETSPYMHMGSVEAMRWCPHEPRVLLTSGDDRRTVLWNAADGSYLTEHSLGGPLNDVQWHPTRPSVLSSSSFEGEIHVHAIHDFGPLVPSWLRRSSGVSFGFGGKLLSFSGDCVDMKSGSPQQQQQQQQGTTKITLKRTVTEKKFVMEAKALVQATREMQPRRFCEEKEAAASTENEKEIWRLMNVLLEQSGGQKQDLLLSEFGFQPPQKQQDNNNNNNNVKENTDNAANANDDIARKAAEDAAATAASLLDENEFWESVQGGGEEEEKKEEGKKEAGDDGSKTEQKKTGEEGTTTTTTTTAAAAAKTERRAETKIDREIRLAIVVADYEKAANLCAKNGRMADAVLIAQMSPDAELWRRVVQQHFDSHPLSWAQQQLLPMVMKDFQKVVQQADLSSWRETVATLVSYTYDTPNFAPLLNELASRLESAGNTHAATLCYMVSGNIEKAVERWLAEGAHSKEGSSSQGAAASSSEASAAASALQAAIEKLHFYSLARGCNGPPSMIIAKKYCEYAGLLAAQGEAADALFYLKSAIPNPNPKDIETISLLERLNLAIEEEQQQQQQQQYSQQQQQQQHYSQQQHHHHQQQQQQPQRGRQMGMPPHMGGRRGPAPGPRPTRPGGMLRQTPGRTQQQQQQPVAALRRPQVAAAASGGAMRMMPPAAGRGGVGSGPRRMMPPPTASAAPGNPAARRGGPSSVPGDRSRPPPASAAAAGGGRFGTPMGGGGRFAAAGPAGGRFGPPPSARPGRGLPPRPAASNGGGVQRGGPPAAAGRMLRAPAPGGLMQQQQQQPPPGRTGKKMLTARSA